MKHLRKIHWQYMIIDEAHRLKNQSSAIAADIRTPRTLAARVDCRILERKDVATFDPDLRFLHSVDTPDDYERALQAARPAG